MSASHEPDPSQGGRPASEAAGRPLSLRLRLLGGLLILMFLALFLLAVFVFLWERLDLPTDFFYVVLAAAIGVNLVVLGLFADSRLRLLVVRPVDQMVDGAERIAAGDTGHRLATTGTSELNRLASAVNEMADRLIRNQRALAENVASLEETNRELSEARLHLVRADKLASIGRLAAGIAHEIGNPLGAIMGYVELGRREGNGEAEWLRSISHEAGRIDAIVRGLLGYARPKAASPRSVRVEAVLRDTVGLLRNQGRFKEVDCVLEIAEKLPPVHADPVQLEQVLVNLLLNALDAVEEADGERRIFLTSRRVEVAAGDAGVRRRRREDPEGIDYSHLRRLDLTRDPGPAPQLHDGAGAVEIRVRDTGPGIPDADLRRVFDPFFTTKDPGRGTGLGLAVSARLIEGMGGTMEAISGEESGGATFRVLLPVDEEVSG
ncbi:MAG: ATP-binding protein [Gemmatimonadota bacterium]|nr:ATP-binding protein [Gemmatimonadota bacterium]